MIQFGYLRADWIQLVVWIQQGRNWHLDKIEISIDFEYMGKNTQFKIHFKSELKIFSFLWKI